MARAKRTIAKREQARADSVGQDKVVATNRRARYDYSIVDTMECGISLTGSEVKSLREGRAQITEGYGRVDNGELWLYGTHIPPWIHAHGYGAHDPDRKRKLLVHRREIDELLGQTRTQPLTIVPLRLYFTKGKAKVEIALAKGKKSYDRRADIAKRDADREMDRARRHVEKFG